MADSGKCTCAKNFVCSYCLGLIKALTRPNVAVSWKRCLRTPTDMVGKKQRFSRVGHQQEGRAMTALVERLDADLLVGLWHGDNLSAGYVHSNIALALACLLQPAGPAKLCKLMKVNTESWQASTVEEGFNRWRLLGSPTVLQQIKPNFMPDQAAYGH